MIFFVLFSAKNKDILKTIYTWITKKYEASSNILYNESMKKFYKGQTGIPSRGGHKIASILFKLIVWAIDALCTFQSSHIISSELLLEKGERDL